MPSKPYDSTLKDLIEGHAADWAVSFGDGPVTDVRLVDADVSTLTAAADKVICARGASVTGC